MKHMRTSSKSAATDTRSTFVGGLLTVKEVSERLRCTPTQIRVWVASGELPAINLGGEGTGRRLYIEESSVGAFLSSRRTAA